MRVSTIALALVIWLSLPSFGQACPKASETGPDSPSEVRSLEGQLVFHDGLRKWFELKLDQPQCGQSSTELVRIKGDRAALEVLRGCRVRSMGAIDFSQTGYYSLDTYQDVQEIEPIGSCLKKAPFVDYSQAKPDRTIGSYRVAMHIEYGREDQSVTFRVTSRGKELRPWQAYASYFFTGGFVLYGQCGEGFVVGKVFGTPQARPGHFEEPYSLDDMAMFNPEGAAASGTKNLRLGYTCVRSR
jgi:hypothetical protein